MATSSEPTDSQPSKIKTWLHNDKKWDKLNYHFNKLMAIGFWPMLGMLAAVALSFVLTGALALYLFDIRNPPESPPLPLTNKPPTKDSIGEDIWQSLMHALDTGTVGSDGDWIFRLVMLVVTIFGVFVMASLISIFSSALERNIAHIRKGRTTVVEKDYTLILGWLPAIFNVVSELVADNRKGNADNKGGRRIVILAAKGKVEMEDEIRARLDKVARKRWSFFHEIICRTGNPLDINDLQIVKPYQARSIIILSPSSPKKADLDADDPDAIAIKTLLAIQHLPDLEKKKSKKPPIILEVRDEGNIATAELVNPEHNGLGKTHIVASSNSIARIIAQTCRQAGMSEIYTDLLNVNANQIYFVKVEVGSKLTKATFENALYMLPKAVLIGLKRGDEIRLNPLSEKDESERKQDKIKTTELIQPDDEIIVIAASMSDVEVVPRDQTERDMKSLEQYEQEPDNTLILGWNSRGDQILTELNSYVKCDSKFNVKVVADKPNFDATEWKRDRGKEMKVRVKFQKGDPTSRVTLGKLNIGDYRHIIVLGDHDLPPQKADWNTLVTLLNLRKIKKDLGQTDDRKSLSIVSEMLVDGNSKLAEATRDDEFGGHDFIVSDKLISSYMTQVSCNGNLQSVFEELLTDRDMEIYLKPVEYYVETEESIDFHTVIAAAAQYNECAIGYRSWEERHNEEKQYGIHLNPPKTEKTEQISFNKNDLIIVIAKEEYSERRKSSN